jgi:hypothetical protein
VARVEGASPVARSLAVDFTAAASKAEAAVDFTAAVVAVAAVTVDLAVVVACRIWLAT